MNSHFRYFAYGFLINTLFSIFILGSQYAVARDDGSRDEFVWRSLNGPWGGIVVGLSMDPFNPFQMLCASEGGIFRSENCGVSWIRSSEGIPDSEPVFYSIQYDPNTPGTVVAAGNYNQITGSFKSIDGGLTWTYLNIKCKSQDIWIHPAIPERYLLGCQDGLFLSEDGGQTWNCTVTSHYFRKFDCDPENPEMVYAAVDDRDFGISDDGGLTWHVLSGPASFWNEERIVDVRSLCVIPGDPLVLLMGYIYILSGKVFRTIDEGISWEPVLDAAIGNIRRSPANPEIIWATGGCIGAPEQTIQLYRSQDKGLTWSEFSLPNGGYAHQMVFDPSNPDVLFIPSSVQGILRSCDGGNSWAPSNLFLAATSIFELDLPSNMESLIYTTVKHIGFQKSETGGLDWNSDSMPAGFFLRATSNPGKPNQILTGGNRLFKSNDYGNTWTQTNMQGDASLMKVRFSSNHSIAYAVRSSLSDSWGVYKSTDEGSTWIRNNDLNFSSLASDISSPETVLASGRMALASYTYRTTDAGSTWESITSQNFNNLENSPIQSGRFYGLDINGALFLSTDFGNTWDVINFPYNNNRMNTLYVSSINETLYAGADSFYVSSNGGGEWTILDNGLPEVQIEKTKSGSKRTSYSIIAVFTDAVYGNGCLSIVNIQQLISFNRMEVKWYIPASRIGFSGQRTTMKTYCTLIYFYRRIQVCPGKC